MPRRTSELLSGSRASEVLVVVAAGAALVSAAWGMRNALDRMEVARSHYSGMEPRLREEAVERALGFDPETWTAIRRSVRADDRFVVVSDATEQHEVRNYANYTLLPAIQVADRDDATVVLYWANKPPQGSRCTELAQNVCIERRGGS